MPRTAGIRKRHSAGCPSASDRKKRCRCSAGWEATVRDPEGRKVRRVFPTEAAAAAWRIDSLAKRQRGAFRAPAPTTIREAAKALLDDMRTGVARTRSGDPYKPSVIRSYEEALNKRILPDLGGLKLARLIRRHVQAIADQMIAENAAPSTIRNALMPLRVIVRRALEDAELLVNPLDGVRLPTVRGRRDRIVSPERASELIAALPTPLDRAAWGLAFYAGLRRGEILGLGWQDLDLAAGIVHVRASLDVRTRELVAPKSAAGLRRVPIAAVLRELLVDHRLDAGHLPSGTRAFRFDAGSFAARARRSWNAANEKRAENEEPLLEPVELHEARHTAASLWIAAGVDAKALQTYLGHSSIVTTYDRYGHLMPGAEREHAAMLDAYLERANTRVRLAQID